MGGCPICTGTYTTDSVIADTRNEEDDNEFAANFATWSSLVMAVAFCVSSLAHNSQERKPGKELCCEEAFQEVFGGAWQSQYVEISITQSYGLPGSWTCGCVCVLHTFNSTFAM